MYKFYNAHPKGKLVDDCVKRAISKASGIPYNDVKNMLNRNKQITGTKEFNEKKNWEHLLNNYFNATKLSFPAKKGQPRMNGKRFCLAYPIGNYILQMSKHLTCCINGIIYDTWDCTDKCVYNAWQI